MSRILIIEDDLAFATMMQTWLTKKGFEVEKTGRVKPAVELLSGKQSFDLVLSDLRLPDHDGLFLLQWMRKQGLMTPFIIMTGYAEVQNAVLAMKSGATDYIAKPFQPTILLQKIQDALSAAKTAEEQSQNLKASGPNQNFKPSQPENLKTSNPHLKTSQPENLKTSNPHLKTSQPENLKTSKYIEGRSEASRQLYEYVSLVAPTPMSVLILGASGTGKEYVARRIHEGSPRRDKPFFALDCGAIPKEVAASEFFGYKRGAFTGADQDKQGAFIAANGGTLFLDEVGNLSYDVQVQLLRALQERRVRPLGGTKEVPIDIRLVCATNENLAERVAEGKFREDLYHRINEFTILMPALRERGTDLFLFAELFLRQADEELGREVVGFDTEASEMLAAYDWPGNLRELNNVVKRAVLLSRGKYVGADELKRSMTPAAKPESLALHDSQNELERIRQALAAAGGNKAKAARLLGVDRKTLYNKLNKYGEGSLRSD